MSNFIYLLVMSLLFPYAPFYFPGPRDYSAWLFTLRGRNSDLPNFDVVRKPEIAQGRLGRCDLRLGCCVARGHLEVNLQFQPRCRDK